MFVGMVVTCIKGSVVQCALKLHCVYHVHVMFHCVYLQFTVGSQQTTSPITSTLQTDNPHQPIALRTGDNGLGTPIGTTLQDEMGGRGGDTGLEG